MLSMGKDGATVVDMVADWLEENGYDGLTDGRCSCTGGCLMHCGLVRSRRCSAAHLFPCTRCTHLTTCDRPRVPTCTAPMPTGAASSRRRECRRH